MAEKRESCQVKDDKYLVLTESTFEKGKGWTHKCGTLVLGAEIAHPIWDGPGPCSGSGECQYDTVPYCPACENKPDFHGQPITP